MSYVNHLQKCLDSDVFRDRDPGTRVEIKTGFGWKPATVVGMRGPNLVVSVDGEDSDRLGLPFVINFRKLDQEPLL